MKYRQTFGLTWQELMDTPISVFARDMQMLEIEASVQKQKEQSSKNQTRRRVKQYG